MRNASFYVLVILVFSLVGSPMYQSLDYKFDNLNTIGVNAFAESDEKDRHDSQNEDDSQENEHDNQTDSEDNSKSEDDTEDNSEDHSDVQSENSTSNHEDSEDYSEDEDQSEDNSDIQSENDTDNESERIHDKQNSETKTEQLISQLEQKIKQLEQRIQSLLEKVQNGQYFGNHTSTDAVKKSFTLSFDGNATSVQDQSVSAPLSADIFAENLVTKDGYSKLKVTGGQIDVGQTAYDIVFGKIRLNNNSSGQGSHITLVSEVMDENGNITTMRVDLNSAQSFKMTGIQSMDLRVDSPQSKIAGQWFLSGTGNLSS